MRVAGNTPYFRTPKPGVDERKSVLVIALLTALIPPFGLICLWRGTRCNLRGKLILSVLGFLSMALIFGMILGSTVPRDLNMPITYKYFSVTPAPSVAPTAPVSNAAEPSEPPEPIDGVVPANPAG